MNYFPYYEFLILNIPFEKIMIIYLRLLELY